MNFNDLINQLIDEIEEYSLMPREHKWTGSNKCMASAKYNAYCDLHTNLFIIGHDFYPPGMGKGVKIFIDKLLKDGRTLRSQSFSYEDPELIAKIKAHIDKHNPRKLDADREFPSVSYLHESNS